MRDKIYFSLGPVQRFISQARRTRDLWTGSFLLSYLAGCALNEMQARGGEIIIPDVSEDILLAWIKGLRKGEAPTIGSLPSSFEVSAINPNEVALSAVEAIRCSWRKIAQAVWAEFVANVAKDGRNTKVIWDRQVDNFWEITWVIGPNISSMNSRKNWRVQMPPVEAGDHCTMMDNWQELSGFIRSKERVEQDEFWYNLKSKVGKFDLRNGERLCALALIKRLFPRVSKEAIGWQVETENWPSTIYVAAIPWLKHIMSVAREEANDYAASVLNVAPNSKRRGVSARVGSFGDLEGEPFLDLDGNFYFEDMLADWKRTPLGDTPVIPGSYDNEPSEIEKRREELRRQLNSLVKKADSSPISFYSMLLMDGDNTAKLIGEHRGELISKALSVFNRDVRNIVQKHNGIPIYVAGDDVLAMLPVTTALSCASSLSDRYEKSMAGIIPTANATISAGLVFSHYHVPLRMVMDEARYMLKRIAKRQNGRGSIAVCVLKTSGKYCQWTTTWDRLAGENGMTHIDDLVTYVREGPKKQFSTSFFYGMRDDLAILSGDIPIKPGSYGKLVEGIDPCRLLTAEYMKSKEQKVTKEEAEERVKALLELSYKSHRTRGIDRTLLSADAAMLVKFLSQNIDGGSE